MFRSRRPGPGQGRGRREAVRSSSRSGSLLVVSVVARGRDVTGGEAGWVGVEGGGAARVAEGVGAAVMAPLRRGGGRIDGHAAHRVDGLARLADALRRPAPGEASGGGVETFLAPVGAEPVLPAVVAGGGRGVGGADLHP